MSSDAFYNENKQAIKKNAVVARDSIPALAIQLLIAREPEFASFSDDELIYKLYDIIKGLQYSYEHHYHNLV